MCHVRLSVRTGRQRADGQVQPGDATSSKTLYRVSGECWARLHVHVDPIIF